MPRGGYQLLMVWPRDVDRLMELFELAPQESADRSLWLRLKRLQERLDHQEKKELP